MEVGKLNQRIEIQEQIVEIDTFGNHINHWKSKHRCWAYITEQISDEKYDTAVIYDEMVYNVYIRQNDYTKHLTTTNNRILFRGEVYDIEGIYFDFNRKDYIRMQITLHKKGNHHVKYEC